MSTTVSCELALAMSLALESSELDLDRARTLCQDRTDPNSSRELALQLLARARRRIETVRIALGQAAEPMEL